MAKTKMDRALEILEAQAKALGIGGDLNTSDDAAQIPTTIETAPEGGADAGVVPAAVEVQAPTESIPPKIDTPETAEPATEEQPSDDFDKQFAELEALLKEDQAPAVSDPVDAGEEPKKEEPLTEEQDQNFKKLHDAEIERRIAAEGEARQAAAEAKYRKNMFEKEGEKKYENIDKQKELEAELRIAKAAATPEAIAPLWQSYLVWKESGTPVHKYRAIKDALSLVEEMTWVSSMGYYEAILRAENKDIPWVDDTVPTTSKTQTQDKIGKIPMFL